MGIGIQNLQSYNPARGLLSMQKDIFSGVNAMASLISDRKTLQSGQYKQLLKEYYALEQNERPVKKINIKEEVKSLDRTENKKSQEEQVEEAKKELEQLNKTMYNDQAQYGSFNPLTQMFEAYT